MEREITRKEFNKIQKRFIKSNPVCSRCGGQAHEAHHVQPIIYGGTNEESNLAPLCSACHKELDIWEDVWVQKMGAFDFECFFTVFCTTPSTRFLAALVFTAFEKDMQSPAVDTLLELACHENNLTAKMVGGQMQNETD